MDVALLGEVPHRAAELWGARTALYFRDRKLSYLELRDGAIAVSEILAGLGVGGGQRVAIYMENRPEYLHAYFGVPSTGAIVVPLNTFLAPEEVAKLLSSCGASVLLCSESALERVAPLLRSLGDLRHVVTCDDGRPSGPDRTIVPPHVSLTRLTSAPSNTALRVSRPPIRLPTTRPLSSAPQGPRASLGE